MIISAGLHTCRIYPRQVKQRVESCNEPWKDKTGDAIDRASSRSSLLRNPNVKFFCETSNEGRKRENQQP